MFKKLLYGTHRILGTILSILFLVWFLSGFVMLFHKFPKVPMSEKYANMDAIEGVVPDLDSIFNTLSLSPESIRKLSLKTIDGHSCFEIITEDNTYITPLDSTVRLTQSPDYPYIQAYAERWVNADIVRVDTLRELEQWIPFGRLREDFPIYKFYYGDKDKHQLYVSSVTGEPLQFTDKNNRFWAWLGPIPHWIYFTSLRQDSQLWVDVVVWLSGIGCIMCIAGMTIGIRSYWVIYRKKKKWKTPYKKPAYKWHHILGFVFGIFVFTFVFSGMMSLATVPKWIVKVHNPDIQRSVLQPEPPVLQSYKLDYTQILKTYPKQVKSIEWTTFGNIPLYRTIIEDQMHFFSASTDKLTRLYIDERMIRNKLSKIHSEEISISLMHEYDNYYVDREHTLPLPVYKIDIADKDNSTYYIQPENGNIRYFNTNSKVRRWTYQVLHSFELGFLVKHLIAWNIIMWVTMIGGTLVSLTGVWLGVRYIKRKIKKRKGLS